MYQVRLCNTTSISGWEPGNIIYYALKEPCLMKYESERAADSSRLSQECVYVVWVQFAPNDSVLSLWAGYKSFRVNQIMWFWWIAETLHNYFSMLYHIFFTWVESYRHVVWSEIHRNKVICKIYLGESKCIISQWCITGQWMTVIMHSLLVYWLSVLDTSFSTSKLIHHIQIQQLQQ